MSRSGPPGRTAAERSSLDTGTSQTPPGIAAARPDLGPEAEAWIEDRHAEALAAGTPVSRRFLRQRLLREWRRELDPEPHSSVLTYLTRHGSVPVDSQVGERVTSHLRRSA